ncbi:DUF4307 domain-containing protein [Dermatophilus congolensis]|uniref:DUF4307 domain-containing protein n=1 Tax=Dermatophilus congolensis TaxID=1863 RepID=A0A239VRM9_9MICO|nr:DUF4307 domain-containing protein [Dermatophilus congolensis]MBO3129852.1 DUF4307 domain-containing protein [Dermatophilus congolensis]MBO3131520.1 DUF4307 domain-containing protein [Dermatophilus congolensis]MBO3134327.1 DUF4307 domain-containing protein [Dermatophilus congolensis]MBO3136561.1 DUF4307 domain-containing protein [Dermatophilus congolensis]MBO3138805.1 DUF4307 domain-containing protein [Dermatophilus congolensis]
MAEQPDSSLAAHTREANDAAEAEAEHGRSIGQYWKSISPTRRKVVAGAAAAVVVGSAVATWFGLAASTDWPLQRDLAYDVHDASSVTVRFEVTKPPEMTAVCEVVAQEVGKAVVGRENVTIPAAKERTTQHQTTVRTTTTAVIGLVKTCRPADR